MTDFTQDTDVFTDTNPGITIAAANDSWTIQTDVLVSSARNDGVFGDRDSQSLVNNGAILSGSELAAGVAMLGNNSSVTNAGGARIIGAFDGLFIDADTALIDNKGSLLGLTHMGVDLNEDAAHVTLNNSGAIFGREAGVRDFTSVDGATIHNFGVISSLGVGIDVATEEGLTTTISNAAGAIIRGDETAIVAENGGAISLTNLGRIVGNVETDFSAIVRDVVVNQGKIVGNVFLGAGSDAYNGAKGTVGTVFGEDGDDRLVGGAAAETLDGGSGNDTLIGHGGADRFQFEDQLNPASNVDTIADFTVHVDKIVLDGITFHGVGQPGVLAAAKFHVGASAADASDRIIYNPNNGFLFFDADGKGGSGQVHFATLTPHLDLHNTDFLVAALLVM